MSDVAYERLVTELEKSWERRLKASARSEYRNAIEKHADDPDYIRDAMIDALEDEMFGADAWTDVEAVDISDVAHSIADEALRELRSV